MYMYTPYTSTPLTPTIVLMSLLQHRVHDKIIWSTVKESVTQFNSIKWGVDGCP